MSRIAEELKRKISDRKFAIECLGMESEITEEKGEDNTVEKGKELLQMALENSQEASNAVVQNGYHILQSNKSSFWKKIDIFTKRVIRKLIYICFGFYIKPILNKQTVFNGKTINAVTAIQDWCFLKQDEIDILEKKWKIIEQNSIEREKKSQQLFLNLEEKINLLIQKDSKEKELTEMLKQKEKEISFLKSEVDEIKKKFLLEFENIVTEIYKLQNKCNENQKKQNEEVDLLKTELSNIEKEVLSKVKILFNDFSEHKELISVLSNKITDIEEHEIKELKENKGILSYLRNKFGLYYDLKMIEDCKIDYFDFENYFRGSRTIVKESQRPYIQYFQMNSGVEILDLGCGRGEFLELMYDYGIKAKGVEVYEPFVNYCRERGFEVIQEDALTYLNTLPDASVGGVFMGQVLEHLEKDYLVALINCIYRKLKVGCYFIAETPNPETLSTYCNFYLDFEHMQPVHYLSIKYFLEVAGFSEVSRYNNEFSKYPFDLKTIGKTEELIDEQKRLNEVLFGYRDYTVIAKK